MPSKEDLERKKIDDDFWASVNAKPKVIYPIGDGKVLTTEYDTEEDALVACAAWNKTHPMVLATTGKKIGAYMVASGVMATDPLYPYRGE